MMTHEKRHRGGHRTKARHLAALTFFLCAAEASKAGTNTVTGFAYGTNYAALATAESIASIANSNGTLTIGFEGTTNLTLAHTIAGFVAITNETENLRVNAAGAVLRSNRDAVFFARNSTNLTLSGGRFIGTDEPPGGGPPLPGREAAGGWFIASTAEITDSGFSGVNSLPGMILNGSELSASNVTVTGGSTGIGLFAGNQSRVTIHSGSFTGGVGTTAFYLLDSDATVHDGTFAGNLDGTETVAGDGLFSELTEATTNEVALHGGTFSSLAFYGTNGAVQHFLAGTNLVVQNGIIQSGGSVVVDNRSDSALTDILILNGSMSFPSNAFTLTSGGSFILEGQDSSAFFDSLNIASNATMDIGIATITANAFAANSFSSNLLTISDTTNGSINTQTAWFQTNSVLVIDASTAGITSTQTNAYTLISADTNRLFAGASTNSAATEDDLKDNLAVETSTSDRTRFIDLFFDSVGGRTLVKFQFTAKSLSDYWDLAGGTSTVVTEEFANELDQLAGSEMLAIIDGIDDPAESLTAVEDTYFTTRNTFQTVLYGMQAAVGQSASRGAEFREQMKLSPGGARGPRAENDLRGWAKYYGQRYDHDADGLNRAYESSLDGGVIGVDKSLGGLLVGIGGGYGRYSTTYGRSGEEEIEAYHGALYGTMGMDNAYIDAGAAYGFNQVESRTSAPFVLNGEFDAQIMSAYLGGGFDLVDSTEGMVFTPEAAVQYSMYEQDGYSETGGTAVPRRIGSFDADSLRTSLGLNVSVQESIKMEGFSFKYDVRAHWIREFNPDPGNLNFSLEGGSNGYQLTYPMLDEDVYRVGIGAAFFNTLRSQPKNVLFRIDFDELFGDGFNSHNFSAKVIYVF